MTEQQSSETEPSKDRELYLRLYEGAKSDYRFYLDGMHRNLSFYSALSTAVFGAAAYQYIEATKSMSVFFAIAFGLIAVIAAGWFGILTTGRYYRASLETVTKIAKCESALGLTSKGFLAKVAPDQKWSDEPFVPLTHQMSRNEYANTFDFVNEKRLKGEFCCIRWFFYTMFFGAIGFLTLIGYDLEQHLTDRKDGIGWMIVLPSLGVLIHLVLWCIWNWCASKISGIKSEEDGKAVVQSANVAELPVK